MHNYYTDFKTGNIIKYKMNSILDTPEKREEISELNFRLNYCQITNCKKYNTCDKIQIKGDKVKCINYESIFKTRK